MNKITLYNENCISTMDKMVHEKLTVDLTITSPPYDDLRTYDNQSQWNFNTFKEVAKRLYQITKDGGIVVWIVNDATINGGETLSSFRQAIYMQEIGFKMHDTMIYEKNGSPFPAKSTSKRYTQIFEYMFIFVKGKIRNDIKLLCDKPNKYAGETNWGTPTVYDKDGNLIKNTRKRNLIPPTSIRNNIWKFSTGFNDKTSHPAVFPEKLAEDHILSWSIEDDIVFDPFMGSGTTGKMSVINYRNFIGCEINKLYFDEAEKRINKYNKPKIISLF